MKLARLNLEKSINAVFLITSYKVLEIFESSNSELTLLGFSPRSAILKYGRVNSHVIKIHQSLIRTTGNQSTSFKILLNTRPTYGISLLTFSWFEIEKNQDRFKSIFSVHGTLKDNILRIQCKNGESGVTALITHLAQFNITLQAL